MDTVGMSIPPDEAGASARGANACRQNDKGRRRMQSRLRAEPCALARFLMVSLEVAEFDMGPGAGQAAGTGCGASTIVGLRAPWKRESLPRRKLDPGEQ
jgi:hypothetical protein